MTRKLQEHLTVEVMVRVHCIPSAFEDDGRFGSTHVTGHTQYNRLQIDLLLIWKSFLDTRKSFLDTRSRLAEKRSQRTSIEHGHKSPHAAHDQVCASQA